MSCNDVTSEAHFRQCAWSAQLVVLSAVCLLAGASTVCGGRWRCDVSAEHRDPEQRCLQNRSSAKPGKLSCGLRAVYRTCSHLAHASLGQAAHACTSASTPGTTLRSGPRASTSSWSANPATIVAPGVIDGGMHLRRGIHLAVIGTARLRDGLRSGTFTIFSHLGNGVKGKSKFSGQWNCGTPPATTH